jgi:hypothetical protein
VDGFEQTASDHQRNKAHHEKNRQDVPIRAKGPATPCWDADKQQSDECGNESDENERRKIGFARCLCTATRRDQRPDCGQRTYYCQEKTGEAEDAASFRDALAEPDDSCGKEQRRNLKEPRGLIAGREDAPDLAIQQAPPKTAARPPRRGFTDVRLVWRFRGGNARRVWAKEFS